MILISKDSKGKIRVVDINYEDAEEGYVIHRTTYQYGGKHTHQPDIIITEGKAKRTVEEQLDLEFNSKIKNYLDKGYKQLEEPINNYSKEELDEIVGDIVTNQDGVPKPMKAKQESKVTNRKIFEKEWIGSRKVDGVRCLMYWDGKEIKTASRGGGANYDNATKHIRNHPIFIAYFEDHPDIILDGELYKHGKSLQQISGAARKEKESESSDWLQYFIYDIVDTNKPFKERLEELNFIESTMPVEFNPTRDYKKGELQVQILPQVKIKGWDNMMKLHNEYVAEGWEGLVIRDPSKPYKPDGRTNQMIKIKMYKDDCFIVTGIKLGLRGTEDMSFELITPDGKPFSATPIGDRAQKQEYWDNFEEKYKGHLGECKFFYYSDEGKPLQPTFKAFRYDIE